MEKEPHIKKCKNFRRSFSTGPPQQEVQWCTEKGTSMGCGGFSDMCPIPEKFIAIDGMPNEQVLFDITQAKDLTRGK